MEATISVTLQRDNGVTVSRSVRVTTNRYSRRPVSDFKSSVRRRAAEAVNSVLGAPADLKVEAE